MGLQREMIQQSRDLSILAGDLSLYSNTISGSSQLSVAPAQGDLMPFGQDSYVHTPPHRHTNIIKNKIRKLRNCHLTLTNLIVVVYACSPSAGKAETGKSLGLNGQVA